MRQDMAEPKCSPEVSSTKEATSEGARVLTYDESKAAEAAFRGEPFNPAWSAAAAQVYAGIAAAVQKTQELEAVSQTNTERDLEYIAS
jgi:hypothetical protein